MFELISLNCVSNSFNLVYVGGVGISVKTSFVLGKCFSCNVVFIYIECKWLSECFAVG